MAIGPEQITDRFKEEIKEFETQIDMALQRSSFNVGTNRIWINAPFGMLEAHFDIIQTLYLKAGWRSVTREYGHQKDPANAIIFEK